MPRRLDEKWLLLQAGSVSDQQTVRNILKRRKKAIKDHLFYADEGVLSLRMGPHLLSMHEYAAPVSIEVYHEIFQENNHFLHDDFATTDLEFVMDIGANEGFYALRIALANPRARVICVEPNPYAFEILTMNISNNELINVVPIYAAASSDGRNLEMEFVRQISSIGGAKLRDVERSWLPEDAIGKIVVESVPIVSLAEQYAFPRIDLLKIDVEGMEDEIIEGIAPLANSIKRIVVERHSRKLRDTVTVILTGLGFELVYEEDPGFKQYYGDLYFLNKSMRATK